MIEKALDITRITRQSFINLIDGLSIEQLNKIPEGYNNNIAWNFGHIVISQQMLCYFRGGVTPKIDEKFIPKYVMGSKPESFIPQDEIDYLKECAFKLIDVLEEDLNTELFKNYQSFKTHFGVTLNNVNEAVVYSATHDNQHLGYARAMKKLV